MKKTYTIEYGPTWWECQVSIDNDFITHPGVHSEAWTTMDCIKYMVEFWDGWQKRLSDNCDSYIKTFLKQLGSEVLSYAAANNWDDNELIIAGLIDEFSNKEGYYALDGSFGIEIIAVDNFSFQEEQFAIMEDPS